MTVSVMPQDLTLEGELAIPEGARAIVLFVHGSGSDRHGTRNSYVAAVLNNCGIATLLIDLLTPEEKKIDVMTRHIRFDIALLTKRVEGITNWIRQQRELEHLKVGYFGSSTGAAATITAASRLKDEEGQCIVKSIVLRGGRPDLADLETASRHLTAPTLFIVGSKDIPIIGINKRASKELTQTKSCELIIIQGASHLFEEPGTMEQVAKAAVEWFTFYLAGVGERFDGTKYHAKAMTDTVHDFFTKMKEFSGAPHIKFKDRTAAGEILGTLLSGKYKAEHVSREEEEKRRKTRGGVAQGTIAVIGIARGGVIVGHAVAQRLSADFDVVVTKRLKHPDNSEEAIGAITVDGFEYLLADRIESSMLSKEYIEMEKAERRKDIERKMNLYHAGKKREFAIAGRNVILVDDGAATGVSLVATSRWIRKQNPAGLIIAIPVVSQQAELRVKSEADKIEAIRRPRSFHSVDQFYQNFDPVSDDDIIRIMKNRG